MKKIQNIVTNGALSLAVLVASFGLVALLPTTSLAGPAPTGPTAVNPKDGIQDGVNGAGGTGQNNLRAGIQTIVNILLFVLGAIAVIAIIIGGIRYTTSNGDQGQLKQAKDTILYAVVGLIVAILAYAIVNFIIGQFT